MLEEDLDDTHLCIKCSATIVGLDNYVQHRKANCTAKATRTTIVPGYGGFEYPDASNYAKSEATGGKTSKTLSDPYDLPYELGADVFFSLLQLQSVQAGGAGGKTTSSGPQVLTRKVTSTLLSTGRDETEAEWQEEAPNNTDNLMKVVRDIGETKKFEPVFKPIAFTHESPEPEQSYYDEVEDDDMEDDDDDDEDYVPTPYSGGKWKPGSQPSPRSGGKWKTKSKGKASLRASQLEPIVKDPTSSMDLLSQIRAKLKPTSGYTPKDGLGSPEIPETGGKWKPPKCIPKEMTDGLGLSEIPEVGGKWKPGFSIFAVGSKWNSPDRQVLESSTGGKSGFSKFTKWKSPDRHESPEVGGKWKPSCSKTLKLLAPSTSGGKRKSSEGHESPGILEPLAEDRPSTSGGKWKPGDDPSTTGGKWKPEVEPSATGGKWKPGDTPPSTGGKWKPADEPATSGGKWKPGDAPSTSGGKWKPANESSISGGKWKLDDGSDRKRLPTNLKMSPLPPEWDDQVPWEEVNDTHPPVEHTRGKWVPGTKVERLEYKEEVLPLPEDFWCNICCRKLKTKAIYERHLRSIMHVKRSEMEQQLERAAVAQLELSQQILRPPPLLLEQADSPKTDPNKRKRRKTFIRCNICKHRMRKFLVGKHLISHYHYVRMTLNPEGCFGMILDNIHQIVLQSPFQCSPCRFYANTEENFLNHWNSVEHRDRTEGPGKFWCSYCRFECEDNNQMRRHLLGTDHREVILAINRSVPIYISKKVTIECPKCHQGFRFNMELRQHAMRCEGAKLTPTGTASDEYQSRFRCELCPDEMLKSKAALQRHEKFKHGKRQYYCSICALDFDTSIKAVKHRKSKMHKNKAAKKKTQKKREAKIKSRNETGEDLRCEKCDHVSSSDVEAMLHQITHPDGCKTSVSELQPDLAPIKEEPLTEEPAGTRKCLYCKLSFKTKSDLKDHLNTIHPESKHICPLCGEGFTLTQELGCHRRYKVCVASTSQQPTSAESPKKDSSSVGKKSWKCSDCTFSSAFEAELVFHRIIHTEGVEALDADKRLKCPLCEKSFPRHSLRHHIRQHTNEKLFTCEICKRSFSRRHNYKEHLRYLHGIGGEKQRNPRGSTDENFICDICGKIFRTKYLLKLHMNTHMERDRQFQCPAENCQYVGRNRSALIMHQNTHMVELDFKCKEKGCIYEGKSAYHLKRHQKNHLKTEKLYKCPECSFTAKRAGHVKRHRRVHTGECPYKCPHCDYRCGYIENLRKHILTTKKHPGKCIYQCSQCDPSSQFKTNFNSEYQLHLTTVHPT